MRFSGVIAATLAAQIAVVAAGYGYAPVENGEVQTSTLATKYGKACSKNHHHSKHPSASSVKGSYGEEDVVSVSKAGYGGYHPASSSKVHSYGAAVSSTSTRSLGGYNAHHSSRPYYVPSSSVIETSSSIPTSSKASYTYSHPSSIGSASSAEPISSATSSLIESSSSSVASSSSAELSSSSSIIAPSSSITSSAEVSSSSSVIESSSSITSSAELSSSSSVVESSSSVTSSTDITSSSSSVEPSSSITSSAEISSASSTFSSSTSSVVPAPTVDCVPLTNGGFEDIPDSDLYETAITSGGWTLAGPANFQSNSNNGYQTPFGQKFIVFYGIARTTSSATQLLENLAPFQPYTLSYSWLVPYVDISGGFCTFRVFLGTTLLDSFQANDNQFTPLTRSAVAFPTASTAILTFDVNCLESQGFDEVHFILDNITFTPDEGVECTP